MEEKSPWNYLGTAFFRNEEDLSQDPLSIDITPIFFKKFLSSATNQYKVDILSNKVIEASDCDLSCSPLSNVTLRLSFTFNYTFELTNYLNVIEYFSFTHEDAASYFLKEPYFGILTDSCHPSSATLKLSSYNPNHYHHILGVDVEVYYCWQEIENTDLNNTKGLYIMLYQEPIPVMPLKDRALDISWNILSVARVKESRNELYFDVAVEHFLISFPEGRMKDRIHAGHGIRVTNVYTPAEQIIQGLQLKLLRLDVATYIRRMVLSLGPILEMNNDFRNESIEVHYRWRGECLEMKMNVWILPTVDDDTSRLRIIRFLSSNPFNF